MLWIHLHTSEPQHCIIQPSVITCIYFIHSITHSEKETGFQISKRIFFSGGSPENTSPCLTDKTLGLQSRSKSLWDPGGTCMLLIDRLGLLSGRIRAFTLVMHFTLLFFFYSCGQKCRERRSEKEERCMHKAKTQCFTGREIYKNSGTSVNFDPCWCFFNVLLKLTSYSVVGLSAYQSVETNVSSVWVRANSSFLFCICCPLTCSCLLKRCLSRHLSVLSSPSINVLQDD